MNLDRFLKLPRTADGRAVVTLMADPSMVDADGQPAGFLSLVDRGANMRRFQVVKAEDMARDPTDPPGTPDQPQAWLARFLNALGLGSLVSKLEAKAAKGDGSEPLTFDAAITRERLRRARWEATDALWEVIGNVMASDLADKPGAVRLALDQFSTVVMGLVAASSVAKGQDLATVLEGLEAPAEAAELATKAGRVISARNRATLESAQEALAKAQAALADLIALATTDTAAKAADPQEDPTMILTPAQVAALAEAAGTTAIKTAKAAGITDPAELARIGNEATALVFKNAVIGPAQAAMPTDTLARQIADSAGLSGNATDPLVAIGAALANVATLATKVAALEKAVNGHGEGDAREPGALELATKAAELGFAIAEKVQKLQGVPAAPRGGGDPEARTETARKAAQADEDTFRDSPLGFGVTARAPANG